MNVNSRALIQKCAPALSNEIVDLLNCVFAHGGFIAGGFASLLYRDFLQDQFSDRHIERAMRTVIGHFYNNGDIDVWFSSEEQYKSFLNEARVFTARGVLVEDSPLAKNFIAPGEQLDVMIPTPMPRRARRAPNQRTHKVCVQVINVVFGQPRDIIEQFDMFNSMVAISSSGILCHKNWEVLRKTNTIDVAQWNSLTIFRIAKYMRNQSYGRVTSSTKAQFAARIERDLREIVDSPTSADLSDFKYDKQRLEEYVDVCRSLVSNFEPETLLRLAVHDSKKTYVNFMNELYTRLRSNKAKVTMSQDAHVRFGIEAEENAA